MKALPHPLAPELRPLSGPDVLLLVGALLLVVMPHSLRAPLWISALVLALYGWRMAAGFGRVRPPGRAILVLVTALCLAGVWIEYRTLFGRGPGIVLLAVFSGLKILESKSHRDATMVLLLCYFLIITNFLYTQSIPTAMLMVVALAVITTTIVAFNAPGRGTPENFRTGFKLLGYAAPAALVLFLLFPRVQGPLWGLPQDATQAVTGLSDTMSPGNFSSLAQSDAIAFRAEFFGETPAVRARYWRGPVLWDFDGRTWRMGFPQLGNFRAAQGGTELHYAIVIEPHDRPWLFSLETPSAQPERSRYTADGQFLATEPVRVRQRYELRAIPEPRPQADGLPPPQRGLRLPDGFNPRARALASQWRAEASSDAAVLAQAIEFLRAGQYQYTLEPPLLGQHSVDEFLFDTKAGFCEHFSSAFVFLMRAAGVPARVVTGYQGGDLNPVDRILTIRQSDAHAWAEVWLRDRGWTRIDPTAVAMPSRIDSGLARAVAASGPLPLLMRPGLDWLRGLRNNWEALTHRWNVWILGYNPERQRDLLGFIGMRDADWRNLTALLLVILGGMTVLLILVSLRWRTQTDRVERAWRDFSRRLAKRGLSRRPEEGPVDFAARLIKALPHHAQALDDIAERYVELRYGRPGGDGVRRGESVRAFVHRVRRFRAS